jgi:Cd2+/Zn2+-exporting ATPase
VGIDTIAFDKTGTLTQGKPVVTELLSFDSKNHQLSTEEPDIKHLVGLAAGCEVHSEHHLAEAIVKKATELGVGPFKVDSMQSSPGKGVRAKWNGTSVAVGNDKLFEDAMGDWPQELIQKATELRSRGNTVVYVTEDGVPTGLLALADEIRPKALETIKKLRTLGIKHIAMLTGDNHGVAEAIAAELGIDHVYSELLPEQKVDKVEEMKKRGMVAMVGDGVNDAPALAVSDLGIAMGAAGTDVALETADIVLMGDDLTKLPYLLELSRKSKKVVWQNIIFSMSVIIMLLFGVFLIDLPLTLGVIGHEGSTLLVVLNGLRLLWH